MSDQSRIEINMGASPLFLEHILTKDVSTLDALYDLIDNSIDAARDDIIQKGSYQKDRDGLPNSYSGYEVEITISSEAIIVSDNCFGMTQKTLTDEAFVIAQSQKHDYGIGLYGIGLKRSLLKMGETYDIFIDNGVKSYQANFSDKQLGGSKGKVSAFEFESKGVPLSRFKVTNLKSDIKGDIENSRWYNKALEGIKQRYSIYFSKGFSITLNYFDQDSEQFEPHLPAIRTDGRFLPVHWSKEYEGVRVTIDSGIHEDYYFPEEASYSLSKNRRLTKDFGIYFICNDRVIRSASTEPNHGWSTKWHSEYNGFVCFVKFVAKDPSKLPWNTAKSDMRADAPLFLEVTDEIQPIADKYRSEIKKRYNSEKRKPKNENGRENNTKSKAKADDGSPKAVAPKIKTNASDLKAASKNKKLHSQNWETLLPEHFPISTSDSILDNIIVEATSLKISDAPHASILLYRSLIESSVKNFANKTGNHQAVKDHYFTRGQGKKKEYSQEFKDSQGIDLAMTLHWLLDSSSLFPQQDRKKLIEAVKKARSHVQKMNGVVHCQHLVSDSEVNIVRNETVELLEFLVTLGN